MQFDLFARAAALPIPTNLETRLAYIRRIGWVSYPVGQRALSLLGHMIEAPHSHRPPCLLIQGDSNNGICSRVYTRPGERDKNSTMENSRAVTSTRVL